MKNIHSIDTDSFAFTGASATPANTQTTFVDFPSDAKVMAMHPTAIQISNTEGLSL